MQPHPDPLSRMETLEKQLQSIHERMSQIPRHNPAELNRPSGAFEREFTPSNSQHHPRAIASASGIFWLFALLWPIAVSALMLWSEPYWRPLLTTETIAPVTQHSPQPKTAEPTAETTEDLPASPHDTPSDPANVADRVFNLYERLEKLEVEKLEIEKPAAPSAGTSPH